MIHIAEPALIGNEEKYILDALHRNELSWQGQYVHRFEEEFAKFCGVEYALTCMNGTVALHLALLALGIGPGDDVLVPALTYVATVNAVRYCGANPIFCDINRKTWCIDRNTVLEAIKTCKNPKAIIAVHLYGVPADMSGLTDISIDLKIPIIEDAAEAIGAEYEGCRAGDFGDIAIFSFYANKIITTGEGGMVTTNDEEIAKKIQLFRGQGQTSRYFHEVIGYNYRMTNLQAAIGLAQLEQFANLSNRRKQIVRTYRQRLLRAFKFQELPIGVISADWMCTVLLPDVLDRDNVINYLDVQGIETRPIFIPITDMPPYQQYTPPVTRYIASRGISLPTHYNLSMHDIEVVCFQINSLAHAAVA